jgi:hypothetical protein
MRPNQNNNKNRQRGRNNNGGRKHVNPLSRNFESNGPDVKVRGNAAHIAEKYLQLARDAQSSGDPVLAENYLQHAEHYFRIVAAAQPQNQFRPDQPGQMQEMDEDDDFPPMNDRFASPDPMRYQQPQPQPNEQQPGFNGEADEGGESQGSQQQAPQQQGEPAMAGEAGEFNGQQGEGDGHRRRDRNRRRRGRGNGEGGQAGDPSSSPQPEVGELPAFLTAGGPTTVGGE